MHRGFLSYIRICVWDTARGNEYNRYGRVKIYWRKNAFQRSADDPSVCVCVSQRGEGMCDLIVVREGMCVCDGRRGNREHLRSCCTSSEAASRMFPLSCYHWSTPEGRTGHILLLSSIFVACVCCNLQPWPKYRSVILIAIGLLYFF